MSGFESYAYEITYATGRSRIVKGFWTLPRVIRASDSALNDPKVASVVIGKMVDGKFFAEL